MRRCPTCKTTEGVRPRLHLSDYRCLECVRACSLASYHRKRKALKEAGQKPAYPTRSTEWYRAEYQQRMSNPVTRQKVYARARLRRAISDGRIKRQPCEVCGDPNSHGHHDDYNKPLDVRWLCHEHHCEAHQVQCYSKHQSGN